MASYAIIKSDGTAGPSIPDSASPDAQTDLQLVGQNAISYGLDIAQSFYYLLENFAKDTAPTGGSLGLTEGQLWYDKGGVTLTPGLKVYSGTAWDAMAPTAFGTVESATLRFNNSTKKWVESTRVTVSATGVLGIIGPTPGNSVSFQHDDTVLNVTGVSTTAIDIDDGSIATVRLPAITLTTALDETYGGTGQTVYAVGDIVYASTTTVLSKLSVGSNGDVLTLAGGVPTWAAGAAGVSAFNDLSDVDLTGASNNDILYRSGGNWIDSAGAATFNGTNFTATQIAGIVAANLVDKTAVETISAQWTHTSAINMQANITFQDNDQLRFGTGNDVNIDFDSADFVIDGPVTGNFTITGFDAGSVISDRPIHATSGGSESIRVIGDATSWSTADSYISFYDSDQTDHGLQIGTFAGATEVLINSRLSGLHLHANNTEVVRLTSSSTTWTANSITALVLRNAFTTGANATTSATVGDHNGVQYNVGYNETPTEASVGANINTGSFTLGALSIGKMISRTTSTSRSVTLANDADIPVGGSVLVHNGASGGTLTIIPDAGQTLNWVDGSGSLPASATRTLANNSVCTVRKVSSTVWQIWGNGIS